MDVFGIIVVIIFASFIFVGAAAIFSDMSTGAELSEVAAEPAPAPSDEELFAQYMSNAEFCLNSARMAQWSKEAQYYNQRAGVWASMALAITEKNKNAS